MNITNSIKTELISAMVRHAAKKQAAPTAKAAKKLNELWRQLFTQLIQARIPELPPTRWAGLINDGTMKAISGTVQVYTAHPTREKDTVHDEVGSAVIHFDCANKSSRERDVNEDKWKQVKSAISHDWGGVLNFMYVNVRNTYVDLHWKAEQADLPSIPGIGQILSPGTPIKEDDPRWEFSKLAYPLAVQSQALCKLYGDVLKAAHSMWEDLETILANVRTLKQLEKQFPEALPFLPDYTPPAARNQLADPKLVSRARQMLVEGIPD